MEEEKSKQDKIGTEILDSILGLSKNNLRSNTLILIFSEKVKKSPHRRKDLHMTEYRQCIVTETIYPPYMEQGIIKRKEHKALFHQWLKKTCPSYEETPFGDGGWVVRKLIGNDEFLIAVVEYEDETIHEHLPHEIQFTDGEVEKNFKNKKDGWNKLTEDTDSYPEAYENVLFRTSDGRIYYGCFDTECEWETELENENILRIKNVVDWRKL